MSDVVNLGMKYAKEIQQQFALGSLVQGRVENDVDFVGAKTVRVHTVNTVPLNDYDRTVSANRYGLPQEVGDSVQELTMTQDKIARKAGKIVSSSVAVDKDNVLARMNAARSWFVNSRVPTTGRTWFMRSTVFDALTGCEHFRHLNDVGSKALATGQVGEMFGAPVVEVPDDLMPAGVNFILLHKSAAACPAKIDDSNVHVNPPGLSGHLVEGRLYYDTFVFGAKARGVYVDLTTGSGVSMLQKVIMVGGKLMGAGNHCQVRYTADGSDPRYSTSVQTGDADEVESGTLVRVYQVDRTDEKVYPSEVADYVKP